MGKDDSATREDGQSREAKTNANFICTHVCQEEEKKRGGGDYLLFYLKKKFLNLAV